MSENSYYESLSIFKSAMDLVVKLDPVVRAFPQFHKYMLGSELRREALEIVQLTAQANRRDKKANKIAELCDRIEKFKIFCNIAREVKAFKSFEQFAQIMQQVMDVARQAEGWRKRFPLETARTLNTNPKG